MILTFICILCLHRTFNVGNSTYPGMSCPYLRRESDPDEQYYLLNWYLDPEYFLYEGCQCANVRTSKLYVAAVY